jgi:hypothetical protein
MLSWKASIIRAGVNAGSLPGQRIQPATHANVPATAAMTITIKA